MMKVNNGELRRETPQLINSNKHLTDAGWLEITKLGILSYTTRGWFIVHRDTLPQTGICGSVQMLDLLRTGQISTPGSIGPQKIDCSKGLFSCMILFAILFGIQDSQINSFHSAPLRVRFFAKSHIHTIPSMTLQVALCRKMLQQGIKKMPKTFKVFYSCRYDQSVQDGSLCWRHELGAVVTYITLTNSHILVLQKGSNHLDILFAEAPLPVKTPS